MADTNNTTTFKYSGRVVEVCEPKVIENKKSGKTMPTREFIVTDYHPQYPQYITFKCINNVAQNLSCEPGDMVEIEFSLRGREWINPKGDKVYFNSLEARKVVTISSPSIAGGDYFPDVELPEVQGLPEAFPKAPAGTEDDDLPF